MILYRVLTGLVNFFAVMFGFSALLSLALVAAFPAAAIIVFLIIGLVIYTWYANVFLRKVLLNKGVITRKEREWMVVNGIVAIVFCGTILLGCSILFLPSKELEEAMTKMIENTPSAENISIQMILTRLKIFAACIGVILAHIIWTFVLLRKHKDKIV